MDNETYIWLIDSHTKSDCCDNHFNILFQKSILIGITSSRIHTCMIRTSLNTISLKDFCQLFHLLTTQTINNAWFFRVLFNKANNILIHIICLRTYFVIQVRTIKWRFKLRRTYHSQVLLNIHLHFRSSRRRQSNNRCFTDFIDNRTDATIFRTEVMSPFRDTMCFVNSIKRDLHMFQKIYIFFFCQRFGSNI